MRKHLAPVSTIRQEGSTESCKEVTMNDTLTYFVDQLNVFPTLEDFDVSSICTPQSHEIAEVANRKAGGSSQFRMHMYWGLFDFLLSLSFPARLSFNAVAF